MQVNRRDFLKLAGLSFATSFLRPPWPESDEPATSLGRVTDWRIWAYRDPDPGAAREWALKRDEVVEITDAVLADGLLAHNRLWNLTQYGWVYSSWVQPVRHEPNAAVERVPSGGLWAEVTVPYVEMRSQPTATAPIFYRLYYSSVHLVVGLTHDETGQPWYQLKDDQYTSRVEYVPAAALRPIDPADLTPISPEVTDKHLEISLKDQMLYAYEGNRQVYHARVATGAAFSVAGLGVLDFSTPQGEHTVVRKRPSRHMLGFLDRSDAYDLPGVPFCTYFTQAGVAVHGAYWHNDFGHPRSHGCVNVLAADARWVYRWSLPAADYDAPLVLAEEDGTLVRVV